MIQQLPYAFATTYQVLIESNTSGTKILYLPPLKFAAISEIQRLTTPPWSLHELTNIEFQKKLSLQYESGLDMASQVDDELDLSKLANQLPTSEDILENTDDAPIIRLINAMFAQAIKRHASDIHIETYENEVIVRYRIDGVLHPVLELKRLIAPLVTSRVKVMAKLDIAEKRLPQDGRISLKIAQHLIDVRVSTLPSNHGERIVLRILDKQAANLNLAKLGMSTTQMQLIKQMINEPHGIILLTGPTGSGKTTSLYAMLSELDHTTQNILTIEDPIEYDLPGIGQTQVNTKVDMTFAKGLRAILRQDPDVVMIGEIRDLETAEIAIQASLTGHLVLSTLHTNSALASITRLRDMGVEPFLMSTSLTALIAQRLVRKLCDECKQPHVLSPAERTLLGGKSKTKTIYIEQGCEACNHTGFNGRMGIYEIIPIDEHMRGLIYKNAEIPEIEQAIRANIPSIKMDGWSRVLSGETTIAEIMRVTTQLS